MKAASFCITFLPVILLSAIAAAAEKPAQPDAERIKQLAAMLPQTPRGVGPAIDDRQAWQALAAAPKFKDAVKRAERLLNEPIPPLTDALYLDFSKTGNRARCERVLGQRQSRIPTLVLAECIENRGRFLPAIEEAIRAICGDKTWVMPAHDRGLENFHGKIIEIDLRAAEVSWNLATARYWLGEKLRPEARNLIRDELRRRTFAPFCNTIATGKPRMWWLSGTNNWNAVCLAGVTGAALAEVESRDRRALFVAAAEKYVQNFLGGITPDGYCSEGVGYWNYGFGHYVMLAETIRQATGGKLDMMDGAHIRQIALFGRRMEILPGIYPAFADCSPTAQPDTQLMAFLSRRYGWGLKKIEAEGLGLAAGPSSRLFALGLFGFPNSATAVPATKEATDLPLHDWFADAGILVCRPSSPGRHALGAALKGGHNAEQHNHNDVGSFVAALGRVTPLVNPGSEVYTARTFSAHRYDSKVLNSFGHPVPRVAGQLQVEGRQAAAKILKTKFTDKADTLVMDISSAYKVKELKRLERTFVFSREAAGRLTVIDKVEFTSPQKFGTALITFSPWKQLAANRLLVGEAPDAVQVEIAVEGGTLKIEPEQIQEKLPGGRTATRLGLDLAEPTANATITLTISP
jgi:hypothetical protein